LLNCFPLLLRDSGNLGVPESYSPMAVAAK
jgi:hypothetical protein